MNKLLDSIRDTVRSLVGYLAKGLNTLSKGHITPNMITIVGLLAHIYIAWLIAQGSLVWAAILLVVFGLFDTLDGQLARLQNRVSNQGMLLDASTDRMKEVLLYSGVAYNLIHSSSPDRAVWAVLACGGSLLVSYVKAKGETAVRNSKLSTTDINRIFQDGFLRYEIRMFILMVGLLSGYLSWAVIIIAVLAWLTAFERLFKITRQL